MGVIWTLIGKYAIRIANSRMTPKQAMQNWLATVMPQYRVANFASAWNNGIALCTLIDAIQPGLCPQHASLDPKNGLANCELGMRLAEEHLGIERIFDASDLNNPHIDDHSTMTYLSLFTPKTDDRLLEWIKEKIPEFNITSFGGKDWNSGLALAALVDAVQPGLFPNHKKLDKKNAKRNVEKAVTLAKEKLGIDDVLKPDEIIDPSLDEWLMATYIQGFQLCVVFQPAVASGQGLVKADVGQLATFTVDATKAAEADLSINIAGPHSQLKADVTRPKEEEAMFTVTYTPSEPGMHTITIFHGERQVSDSPYNVPIIDLSKCTVSGKALEAGALLKQPYTLTADASRAGPGKLEITLLDPSKENCPVEVTPGTDGFHKIQCPAPKAGVYELTATYAGQVIPQCPLFIHVSDPSACQLLTKLKKGYLHLVNKPFEALLNMTEAGNASLQVTATCGESTEQVPYTQPDKRGMVVATFVPRAPGYYAINMQLSSCHIQGSPLLLPVVDPSLCTLVGLQPRIPVRQAYQFQMLTNQPVPADLDVKISGDNNCNTPQVTRSNGTPGENFSIALHPTGSGKITAQLTWAGGVVQDSPVSFEVVDVSRCALVSISERVRVGEMVNVVASAQGAGDGNMEMRAAGSVLKYECTVQQDGHNYSTSFKAGEKGTHHVHIDWCGIAIPSSPFQVEVLPEITSHQVTAKGPGLVEALTETTAKFDITAPDSGLLKPGMLAVAVCDATGETLDAACTDNGNGTYDVAYTPLTAGKATVKISYAGTDITLSPYSVPVHKKPRPDLCSASGKCLDPANKNYKDQPGDIMVDTSDGGQGKLSVAVRRPDNSSAVVFLARIGKDVAVRFDCDLLGRYQVDIKWSGEHIPKSPFHVDVVARLEAHQLVVSIAMVISSVAAHLWRESNVFCSTTHNSFSRRVYLEQNNMTCCFTFKRL